MKSDWYIFQENIKLIFENLGCDARSNARVVGTRTTHDIDILVRSRFIGHNLKWIIEAKNWNKKITKLHVLALRQIVDDIGADKGLIVSLIGFQKGAIQAATKSNISLLTYDELRKISSDVFHQDILKTYTRRLNYIVNRYFSHSKYLRIKYGLRENTFDFAMTFNVYVVLAKTYEALKNARANRYPIDLNTVLKEKFGDVKADNFYQLINWLNENLIVIEERILKAEIKMQENDEFHPELEFAEESENIHLKMLEIISAKTQDEQAIEDKTVSFINIEFLELNESIRGDSSNRFNIV